MNSSPVSLADALFPRVRQRVLAILFGNADRSFFLSEVVALAQSGSGAVQRELASLADAGLLNAWTQGNQKHYQANSQAPVFTELRGLVLKTSGAVDVLRAALAPLARQITCAFVYGSVARQEDTAGSDVDLLILSPSLAYGETFAALEGAAQQLARKVNPTLYTPEEWHKRRQQKNAFATRVLKQPKLWLIGTEEALRG
ncbi:nucleotidyltransferase domain-containing protein [Ramlibacter humi]|uniref:Transcriptional regulator n=1 Tax=Ramlibacter humi TaxID=2530451 RepID=A0A4Z0CC00_9BURK|nr:nucleotidyltransferase domain-containing protein [Ramlibacter humi]TFZ08901.1 transcriptional regulator [Ramlibacter humi]